MSKIIPNTFKIGQKIASRDLAFVVREFVASGLEGEVWRVEDKCGRRFALKCYHPPLSTPTRRQHMQTLVEQGSPDPRFVWPLDILDFPDIRCFGYIMEWRDGRFKEPEPGLMRTGKLRPNRRALALAGSQLADCFMTLHLRGLCYVDISYNNIAFDPATGEVRIIDNDNVTVDSPKAVIPIQGTGTFRAPEIFRDNAKPNKQTDKHSLAVLLFSLFILCEPFDGILIDEIPFYDNKELRMYGTPAPFIFHPTDHSNRSQHASFDLRWRMLPGSLRRRFESAFVTHVNSPNSRVVEMTWRDDFLQLHDSVTICEHCSAENFFDRELLNGSYHGTCVRCRKPLAPPLRMGLERNKSTRRVVMSPGAKLYPVHIGEKETWDFTKPLAEVIAHPRNPGQLGLRNLGVTTWKARQGAAETLVAPGGVKLLEPGMDMQFGHVTARLAR